MKERAGTASRLNYAPVRAEISMQRLNAPLVCNAVLVPALLRKAIMNFAVLIASAPAISAAVAV